MTAHAEERDILKENKWKVCEFTYNMHNGNNN